jgi:hypothetical protein
MKKPSSSAAEFTTKTRLKQAAFITNSGNDASGFF